jgi:hypothetical protein
VKYSGKAVVIASASSGVGRQGALDFSGNAPNQ